jgi:hypothetical protein
MFRVFDGALHPTPSADGSGVTRATVIGRFFSHHITYPNVNIDYWGGFGHMGRLSVLAIQQVLEVDAQQRRDVDYSSIPYWPSVGPTCELKVVKRSDEWDAMRHEQRAAEGEQPWRFTNPHMVAAMALADLTGDPSARLAHLKQTRQIQGRVVYQWQPASAEGKTVYDIVVQRPYWMSLYARDPRRIAWVVMSAGVTTCR